MTNTQTFNISFPKALVKEIDAIAEKQFASRSDFLRTAAIEYMKREVEWEYIFREGKQIGAKSEFSSAQEAAEWLVAKRRQSSRWFQQT